MRNIVIVCGGRDYNDRVNIYDSLDKVHKDTPITKLVQGWARGTDQIAHAWARSRGIPSTHRKYRITNSDWQKLGKGAGRVRNKRMRDEENVDRVIAFPGNTGTANMIDLAHEKQIPVIQIDEKGRFL